MLCFRAFIMQKCNSIPTCEDTKKGKEIEN